MVLADIDELLKDKVRLASGSDCGKASTRHRMKDLGTESIICGMLQAMNDPNIILLT